jgi:arylsulfatase A-like enzyme
MLAFYSYATAQFEGLNGSPIAHTVAPEAAVAMAQRYHAESGSIIPKMRPVRSSSNLKLPTVNGFDEFFGNLYHLNAEEEPELPDYPRILSI